MTFGLSMYSASAKKLPRFVKMYSSKAGRPEITARRFLRKSSNSNLGGAQLKEKCTMLVMTSKKDQLSMKKSMILVKSRMDSCPTSYLKRGFVKGRIVHAVCMAPLKQHKWQNGLYHN